MTYTDLLKIIKTPRNENSIQLNEHQIKRLNEIKAVANTIRRLSKSTNVNEQEFPLTLEEWCSFRDQMDREKKLKDIGL